MIRHYKLNLSKFSKCLKNRRKEIKLIQKIKRYQQDMEIERLKGLIRKEDEDPDEDDDGKGGNGGNCDTGGIAHVDSGAVSVDN
jgi:hypothetical protein